MLPTGHLLAFALLSYALILVPGPNLLFVISRSLQLGRTAGLAAVAGGQLGVYAQVIAGGGPAACRETGRVHTRAPGIGNGSAGGLIHRRSTYGPFIAPLSC
jgi:hypothetical protein